MLGDGLMLMVVGMTIVFSFLLLLVGMLFAMSWLSARLAPQSAPPFPDGGVAARGEANARLVAAVAAAIHLYRQRQGR